MAKKYLDSDGLGTLWGKIKGFAVKKSGDTMTGKLTLKADQYTDAYNSGALDLKNSNIDGVNSIYTTDASDNSQEGIHFYRDSTHVDSVHAKSGSLYFTPNRQLGSSGTSKKVLLEDSTFYEANLAWGGKNFSASYGCIDAAMIPDLGANRFAFLKAAGLEIEYSTDNGSTWTDYGATDSQKVGLFAKGQGFYLGKASVKANNNINNQLRVTITTNNAGLYTTLNKIAIYMSTSGNTVSVKIEKATKGDPTTYTTHLDWTGISGWSGWNILNISGLTTYGNTDSQYQKVRFTFRQTAINSNYSSASISRIMGFGGVGWTVPSNMAATGHLYNYDSDQNATFPAKVTATGGFSGNITGNVTGNVSGTSANVTGTVAVANGGTGKTTGKDAANYFMNALDTGSSTPADADYYISQYVNGGTTTTTYHRRPMSALWEYIKSKISSVLGLTATTYGGSAAKVNNHTVNSDVPSNAEFTDTTYESKAAAEDGTALSLVTTGEKYLWNNAASGTGSASWNNISGKPTETEESTTGISIGNHATGTVIGVQSSTTSVTGVQSSTTTASKVTLGTALSIPNVTDVDSVTVPKAASSATTVPIKNASATSIPNVTSIGSASNWVFENVTVPIKDSSATTVPIAASSATTVPIKDASATTIPNVTNAGSGSASLTFAMDNTDTKKLIISFSHTHTPPTIGTPISIYGVQSTTTSVTGVSGSTSVTGVQSTTTTGSHVKSGGNGTAPTLGTAISIYGVQSTTTSVTGVSGSTTASKVTLGTAIDVPNVTNVSDVTVPIKATSATTVPIKNTSASTFVTGATHTITDNGHTHSIS